MNAQSRIKPPTPNILLGTLLHSIATLILTIGPAILSICAINTGICDDKKSVPNIVLILADDLGYSDLGCYGSEIETPHLDRLAQHGLRFTSFYNTARCWPTRSSLLSGYYAQQIRRDALEGFKGGAQGVRPAWAKLLPEMLRTVGYRNYHSGKWHIDGSPLKNGFDHSYNVEGNSQSNFFSARGNTEDGQPVPQTENYYVTTAVADHAVKCLREHAQEHAAKPFFHYVCFTAPHFPLHALPEDIAKYAKRYEAGWNAVQQQRYAQLKQAGLISNPLPAMERDVGPPYHNPEAFKILGMGELNRPVPWEELSAEQRTFQAAKMAIHAAMIDRMDQEIGKILAQLKAMNAWENTLILFLSDNGASAEIMVRGEGHDPQAPLGSAKTFPCLGPGWSSCANTPFRRHKTWVHEGGIATPLIVHWPQQVKEGGALRTTPGHVIDIVPTVLEVAGVQPSEKVNEQAVPALPGKSLMGAIQKNESVERESLWWMHEGNKAIRRGDWKLVALKSGEWELYDLQKDRGESENLAAQHPEKVKELAALWQQQHDAFRSLAAQNAPPANETPATKKEKVRRN
jgi:arylsulfatase A-like enzyme